MGTDDQPKKPLARAMWSRGDAAHQRVRDARAQRATQQRLRASATAQLDRHAEIPCRPARGDSLLQRWGARTRANTQRGRDKSLTAHLVEVLVARKKGTAPVATQRNRLDDL